VTGARLEALLRVLLVGVLVLLLEVACRLGWVAPTAVIPPSAMVRALMVILTEGTADADLLATLSRVTAAALLSAAIGLLGGLLLHALPRLRAAIEPVLSAWYAVPTIMFYPVLLVVFGAGAGAIVATAVLLAAVAMVSSTLAGLDRVPPALLRTAQVLRLGRMATAWRVRLPSAAPHLFAGLKLVVAYAFIGVIASEFILSGSGLGYAIANAYNNFDNPTMYGLMLLIVVLVTGVNAGLDAVGRRMRQ
jgi:NitT/TauT family transport system permease protein